MKKILFCLFVFFGIGAANATIIDNSTHTGSTNSGWAQSAQTLSFTADTTLNTFGWWLGQDNEHKVSLVEWSAGPGASLFSSTQNWSAGFNEIALDITLSAGTLYAVLFDYLGNVTSTVDYNSSDDYADGEWWLLSGSWSPWVSGNDMRFVATVNQGQSAGSVPEPASIVLLGLGLGLASLIFSRKKKTA